MKKGHEKEKLLRDLALSRGSVSRGLSGVSHAVNVKERLGRSIHSHYLWWIGGAIVTGIIASGISCSTGKKSNDESTRSSGIGTLDLATFKPALVSLFKFLLPILRIFATQAIEKWAERLSNAEER